jgi:protein gp37
MAENSKIQWTHHTFNPWRGCARVSPGCVHCYAETLSKRNPKTLGTWGVDGARVVASDAMWQQPLKWNKAAEKAGERHRVFCASLADVGEDRPDLILPRNRLVNTILATPHLDWLLLTKRPENMRRLFDDAILERCWVGVTAENQEYADKRCVILRDIPARVRFVSAEPLLGPIDFSGLGLINWVIVGGESGGGARPFEVSWAHDIIKEAAYVQVPVFMKQLGAVPLVEAARLRYWEWRHVKRDERKLFTEYDDKLWRVHPVDHKGGDVDEWPESLRVRQFPVSTVKINIVGGASGSLTRESEAKK